MSKLVSVISLLTIILSFSIVAFGQSKTLRNDLNGSFKKFDLVRINNQNALRQAESNRQLSIQTPAKNFQLSLTPNDLRSPRYRAEDTTTGGTRTLEKGQVTTFKGKVTGDGSSEVRLMIDGTRIEGYFISEGRKHFIEPANRHSEFAGRDDFIIYQEGDLLKNDLFSCHSDIGEKIERGKKYVFSNAAETTQGMQEIELATDADFQFVTVTGGAVATNNEILNTLNMVEGLYQNELNLTISVVFQHTWSTPDPYTTTSANNFLTSFKDYWNANFTNVARDSTHIWTAKPNLLNQGLAYIGTVCVDPEYAYGFSGKIEWNEAKYLITGHEIGHNLGANHADEAQSCTRTLMNTVLYVGTPLTFCTFSRTEVSSFAASNGSCLAAQSSSPTRFDFDSDGKSDISVFRPSNGVWYVANSSGGYNIFQFGQNGDLPVSADFDGDGKADAAVYRGGNWYRLKSSNGTYDGISFGLPTDIPAAADFDGDGKTDVAVFRPSNGSWYILNSSNGGFSAVQFGTGGDVPMPGDYDGDGKADINVFRPSSGNWYRLNSSNGGFSATQFGQNGDKAVSGDFDGDGKYDVGVFRGSNGGWYVLKSSNGALLAVAFGTAGDIPVASDYDGDGKTDISVFRPSGGNWYRLNSSNNSFGAFQFGIGSDIPVQSYYVK
jgi:Metallo-peptidase family M12/FG-GAP-like repeat/Reprolysin family propeptide